MGDVSLAIIDWSPVLPIVVSGVLVGLIVRYLPKASKAVTSLALRVEVGEAIKAAKLVTKEQMAAAIIEAVKPMRDELTTHLSTEEELSRKNLAAQEATLQEIKGIKGERDRERDEMWSAIHGLQDKP